MSNFLVTGAAGFIGSNLVRALLARGEAVRGIDNFATGRRDNLVGLTGLEFIEADINDQAALAEAVRGVDYVLHQAALPSVQRSVEDPVRANHANVTGTLAVLEAARRAGVRRVVYAASSSAYGDTPTLPKVETMAVSPRSPYAVSKLAGEFYCQVYTQVMGLPCVALRYFNVFGPRQDPTSRYAAVIPRFVQCILRDEPPPVNGDGRQTRDFTYIDNVVEANLKACASAEAPGQVFNIACGERIDLLTLIDEINRVLGKHVAPVFQPARPGDVHDSLADINKAKRLLGYAASVDLRAGLERSIAWYRDHLS